MMWGIRQNQISGSGKGTGWELLGNGGTQEGRAGQYSECTAYMNEPVKEQI